LRTVLPPSASPPAGASADFGICLLPAGGQADHAAAEVIIGPDLDTAPLGPQVLVDDDVVAEYGLVVIVVAVAIASPIDLAPHAERIGTGSQVAALQRQIIVDDVLRL